jgi:hypothetical protein
MCVQTHTVLSFIWCLITTSSWVASFWYNFNTDLIEDAICAQQMLSVEPLYFPDIKEVVADGVFQHPSTFHTDIRNSATYWRSQSMISGITFQIVICKMYIIYVDLLVRVSPQINDIHSDPAYMMAIVFTDFVFIMMFTDALSYSEYSKLSLSNSSVV